MSQRIYQSPWGSRPIRETSVYDCVFPAGKSLPAPEDKPALILAATGEQVTYGQLRKESRTLAAGLRQKLQPGQVALIFSPNSLQYHLMLFGCQCAGIVVSPANYAYSSHELAHQLKESGASLIFVHPDLVKTATEAAKEAGWPQKQIDAMLYLAVRKHEKGSSRLPCIDDLVAKEELEPHKVKDPTKQLSYLCFSSGTTSAAKGVMTSHANMAAVLALLDPFQPTPDDVMLACLPFSHIYGLTKLVHWPIMQGMTVVIMPRFELQQFCSYVARYKATVALLVPPVILLLGKEKLVADYDFSSLRLIVSGAAPLGATLEQEVEQRLKVKVRQAYGLTETSPTTHLCALSPIDKPRRGSIGYLLPNMEGRLVDPVTGKDVEEGKEGEIWLRGKNVMLGYLNRPKETAETLVEGGWLRTGDVAYIKDDYWFISDRIKELIKYKGFQVPPAELEAVLITHPGIKDAAVIGIHSEELATELPRAYVVAADAEATAKDLAAFEKDVQAFVAQKVAGHKRLRGGVRVIEEIPKSPSGKLLRRQLKDRWLKEEAPQATAKL